MNELDSVYPLLHERVGLCIPSAPEHRARVRLCIPCATVHRARAVFCYPVNRLYPLVLVVELSHAHA